MIRKWGLDSYNNVLVLLIQVTVENSNIIIKSKDELYGQIGLPATAIKGRELKEWLDFVLWSISPYNDYYFHSSVLRENSTDS